MSLSALERTFFVVTLRHLDGRGNFQDIKKIPLGSTLTVGINWSPVVKDVYDTTIHLLLGNLVAT